MSFTSFSLDPRVFTGITRAGYTSPTKVQEEAIPAVLAGHDLIATAQTGTGKTAAFVLPMLNNLVNGPRRRARALIVTPTRELAEQIHEAIRMLGSGTNLRSATLYGGVSSVPQRRALASGVEILVACPGRLLDHIQQGDARLDGIEMLVLDEADRMLDMGFLPDVKRILSHVPTERQTMLFSATFPEEIERLAKSTLRAPKRITVGLSRPVYTVTHALYPVRQHLKTQLLLKLLENTDSPSVLVFTRTKHRATKLHKQLERSGYRASSLHADRSQQQRLAALNGFRAGTYRILVATDIAARGIDVENISHVINYDMPDTADAYIHRIGRTGRAERSGEAFTLTTPDDSDMVRTLEKLMGEPLQRELLPDFDYNAPAPPKSDGASGGFSKSAPRRANGSSRSSAAPSWSRSAEVPAWKRSADVPSGSGPSFTRRGDGSTTPAFGTSNGGSRKPWKRKSAFSR